MIKPNAYMNIGKVVSILERENINISNIKLVKLNRNTAANFYAEHQGKSFFTTLLDFMTSDYAVALELVGPDMIKRWRELLGPTNSLVAKQEKPNSIRGLFGEDGTKNAAHGSDSVQSANRELELAFGENGGFSNKAMLSNCTCCIIKNHILREKRLG
ncbi:UNVERIFIED_CONTAM: hypothetical protein GTU68_047032 [Idotea baltica]|nr:hypothetical protein [Idotea baltica]